jgi:hypothetical protein
MKRLATALLSAFAALSLIGLGSGLAQEATPDTRPRDDQGRPIDVCAGKPERIVNNALKNEDVALAVVEVAKAHSRPMGAELLVLRTFDGELEPSIVTDVESHDGCSQLYADVGNIAFVSLFVASDGSFISTMQAWALRSPAGESLSAADVDADTDFNELQVVLPNDQIMTVDELLAAGRAYVAPTPTPHPPGVPTLGPVDSANTTPAAGSPPSGIVAPDTGGGGGGGGTGVVAGLSLLALIALAGGVGVVALAAARRR